MQNAIAEEVTTRVHSREDYEMAVKASQILFGKSTTEELGSIDERTLLNVFEGVPMIDVSKGELDGAGDIITLLSDATKGEIFPSKGEARRMIQGGGVSINKEKVTSVDQNLNFSLLQDKYLLVQKGKKNYYLVRVG